jgi:L-histidine Nalpha-methyltransferase
MEDILADKDLKFGEEVLRGLSCEPKYLPSKYLYTGEGIELFKKINKLPDYYLADSEYENLSDHKEELRKIFTEIPGHFNLIEFGPGEGLKTKVLLKYLTEKDVRFSYIPVDISEAALQSLSIELSKNIPILPCKCYCCDYRQALEKLNLQERNIFLFPSNSIANLSFSEAELFLNDLRQYLKKDDLLLIGFDLKKDPDIIHRAYIDEQGLFKSFYHLLLERINKKLGADFNSNFFQYYPAYDPLSGEAKNYLISCLSHKVYIETFDKTFLFNKGEALLMESSHKYDIAEIEQLALKNGYDILYNFLDYRRYFFNTVWNLKSV